MRLSPISGAPWGRPGRSSSPGSSSPSSSPIARAADQEAWIDLGAGDRGPEVYPIELQYFHDRGAHDGNRGFGVRAPRAAGGFELCVPRLTLKSGQRLAFVGPSGCGKSTLLDRSADSATQQCHPIPFRPGGGGVVDLAPISPKGDLDRSATLRRTSIGYVLQQGALLSFLSVFDNIRLGDGTLGRSAVQRLARRLEIEHLLDQRPGGFRPASGSGSRSRVRSCIDPLVLADEPTGSLDPSAAERVMTLFIELAEGASAGLIVASHDQPLADRLGFERLTAYRRYRHGARSVFG